METTVHPKINETIYTETLENGLKVCLVPRSGISETNAYFTTNYGANDLSFIPLGSTEKYQAPLGVAHFLEHKLFDKGDHDVFADFTRLGASSNAYTSPTQTAYLFETTEHVKENLELLLNFVQDPYFTEETVEKEKGIIIQEEQMYADNSDQQLYMATLESMFDSHPVRNEVLGTIESINNITKDDLYTCYHTFYHPSNMTLAMTGNFDPKEIMSIIKENQSKKEFAPIESIERFMPEERDNISEKSREMKKSVTTPKCMIGIKEYSSARNKGELQTRTLLTSMILDYLFSTSGQFYKQLYEQGLIDHSFGYQNTSEYDFGYSLIAGNTQEPETFSRVVKELLQSTQSLDLTELECERMKKRNIGRVLRGMNSTENIAQNFTWYDQQGLDFFELIPIIQGFTVKEINDFMHEWIDEKRITVCTIIPE